MIEVNGLVKQYGDKTALKGISFSVNTGEIVGLLGLNGAGKSTTMNCLTGYIAPTEGTIAIDGHDIVREPIEAKKEIGYLPELFSFYPDMRVEEYLNYVCDLKGVTKNKQERDAHIQEICEKVGIAHMRQRMIRNLSKGYKQRVGFAQALIGTPKVLILDEPTVGLDPSQIIDIRNLVRDAGKESTVIVSSHILSEIQAICSRVIVIHEGQIVADAPPEKLRHQVAPRNRLTVRIKGTPEAIEKALKQIHEAESFTRLPQGEPGMEDYQIVGRRDKDLRESLFHVLAANNLPLMHTYGGEMTLEDVFLHLTGNDSKAEKENAQ